MAAERRRISAADHCHNPTTPL
jgi:hypothetical protein